MKSRDLDRKFILDIARTGWGIRAAINSIAFDCHRLPSQNSEGKALPSKGHTGQNAMQVSRWCQHWTADGRWEGPHRRSAAPAVGRAQSLKEKVPETCWYQNPSHQELLRLALAMATMKVENLSNSPPFCAAFPLAPVGYAFR
jgi:hypothetical protein